VAGAGGGTVDAGNDVCAKLEGAYRDALVKAKTCDPKAPAQCLSLADNSLSCPGCRTHVEDATQLQGLQSKWVAAGCRRGVCPAIVCINPLFGQCSTGGGPGGRCIDVQTISQ
jgi:hypothetical protein